MEEKTGQEAIGQVEKTAFPFVNYHSQSLSITENNWHDTWLVDQLASEIYL